MINIEYESFTNTCFLVKEDLSDFVFIPNTFYENWSYKIYHKYSDFKQVTIAPSQLAWWSDD